MALASRGNVHRKSILENNWPIGNFLCASRACHCGIDQFDEKEHGICGRFRRCERDDCRICYLLGFVGDFGVRWLGAGDDLSQAFIKVSCVGMFSP